MRGQQDTSILAIAGSDSCAGAGLQADLKTAAALGVYACCAVTCVTAQNTTRFLGVQPVAAELVAQQVRAVFEDVPPAAVKIGMVPDARIARALGSVLAECAGDDVPVVFDPVLSASVGGASSPADAVEAMREHLLPHVHLLTPNIAEAEALSGVELRSDADLPRAARALRAAGAQGVLVTGGHGQDARTCTDYLFAGGESRTFSAPRRTGEFHGTGCMLSTAIACHLAEGAGLVDAVRGGFEFAHGALERVHALGQGSKLVDHLGIAQERGPRA